VNLPKNDKTLIRNHCIVLATIQPIQAIQRLV